MITRFLKLAVLLQTCSTAFFSKYIKYIPAQAEADYGNIGKNSKNIKTKIVEDTKNVLKNSNVFFDTKTFNPSTKYSLPGHCITITDYEKLYYLPIF